MNKKFKKIINFAPSNGRMYGHCDIKWSNIDNGKIERNTAVGLIVVSIYFSRKHPDLNRYDTTKNSILVFPIVTKPKNCDSNGISFDLKMLHKSNQI